MCWLSSLLDFGHVVLIHQFVSIRGVFDKPQSLGVASLNLQNSEIVKRTSYTLLWSNLAYGQSYTYSCTAMLSFLCQKYICLHNIL